VGAKTDNKTVFKTADVALTITSGETILRPSNDKEAAQELLIQLSLPKGKSTYSVDYTLLR
jgi:hypothetical protein